MTLEEIEYEIARMKVEYLHLMIELVRGNDDILEVLEAFHDESRTELKALETKPIKTLAIEDLTFEYFYTPTQLVNEGPAGVRVIHKPTGLQAISDDSTRTLDNKVQALTELTRKVNDV